MTEQEKIISLAKACKLHCGDFGVGALMNTEDKIREAFTKSFPLLDRAQACQEEKGE